MGFRAKKNIVGDVKKSTSYGVLGKNERMMLIGYMRAHNDKTGNRRYLLKREID